VAHVRGAGGVVGRVREQDAGCREQGAAPIYRWFTFASETNCTLIAHVQLKATAQANSKRKPAPPQNFT